MSVLTNPFIIIPTISLVVQVAVLGLLIYGYWLKRHMDFQRHGRTMSIALILHLIVIFTIMVPSFVVAIIPEFLFRNVFGSVSIISLIHVPLGVSVFSLGLWFVIGWRLKGLRGCFNRKKYMLYTIIAWIITLSLGILLYSILIVSLLKG
jgi:uncharacterized membrane protein YozB (DUF420 family)